MFSDCQEILGDLVGDRRTADIEPRFQKIISNFSGQSLKLEANGRLILSGLRLSGH
jgi:hypothetical protein